ncbi:MAG: hypothetical protein ACOX8H_06550 [Ruminococcus sp.]
MLTIDIQNTKEANESTLLKLPELPDSFIDQFMKGFYYDGINIHDESVNCFAAYSTDPEDINNECDSFYFYLN